MWIEITVFCVLTEKAAVTSLAEVWIEILFCQVVVVLLTSVTSLAEVWIEIQDKSYQAFLCHVTSLAEVWIEMIVNAAFPFGQFVTSLAEVWIEICTCLMVCQQIQSHFPCGSVD